MMRSDDVVMIPLARATLLYQMSRERLLRRAQSGEIPATQLESGRWLVAAPSGPNAAALEPARRTA